MSNKNRHGQRGTQLVELALLLPILSMLALMVSEGAGFIRAHIVLNNAAREGARVSVLKENQCVLAQTPSTCITAIQNVVINYAGNNGITLNAANVTVNQAVVIPGGSVVNMLGSQVTVTYTYKLTFLPNFIGSSYKNIALVGQAVFRNQY